MKFHCEICDKVMNEGFRNNHLESKYHSPLVNSSIRRYFIANPIPNKIDDIIRKYLKVHFEKYEKFNVTLLLKLLTLSNQIKYIRIQCSNSRFKICVPNAFFFSKIIKKQLYSQILGIGITFVNLSKNMTFEYYLTQHRSVLEWKLNAKMDKDPKMVTLFDYRRCCYSHPLIREYFDIYIDQFY